MPAPDADLRTRMLLGDAAVERLARSSVLLVGLGAVGSFAAEALVRAGVGALRIADFDRVSATDLNRQLFPTAADLGRSKVEVAVERLRALRPGLALDARETFVHADTLPSLLEPCASTGRPPELVVDAIDSLNPKLALLEGAVRAGFPVLSCLGAARRLEPAALRVAPLPQTHGCPLARLVRKHLRRRGIEGREIRCVFSPEPPRPVDRSRLDAGSRTREQGRPRVEMGSLVTVVGVAGLLLAHEALRLLAGEDWPAPP